MDSLSIHLARFNTYVLSSRLIFQRPVVPTVPVSAISTPSIRFPSTRLVRLAFMSKVCRLSASQGVLLIWANSSFIGKRRYDRKQAGYGGQTKPVFHKKAKTTKKIVLRLECNTCKRKHQLALKRCKHFELGGDKKTKVLIVASFQMVVYLTICTREVFPSKLFPFPCVPSPSVAYIHLINVTHKLVKAGYCYLEARPCYSIVPIGIASGL